MMPTRDDDPAPAQDGPMRITAEDIERWGERPDAPHLLPVLMRRLVHGTVAPEDLRTVDFPSDTGTRYAGVDGRVESAVATAFVPSGRSVWELTTEKSSTKKATRDLSKRHAEPGVTFIHVTTRRWAGAAGWAHDARSGTDWEDVRAYDAHVLAQWVERSIAAHAWLASELGAHSDIVTLESAWRAWSKETEPRTVEALVLAGRDVARREVLASLNRRPTFLRVRADDMGGARKATRLTTRKRR